MCPQRRWCRQECSALLNSDISGLAWKRPKPQRTSTLWHWHKECLSGIAAGKPTPNIDRGLAQCSGKEAYSIKWNEAFARHLMHAAIFGIQRFCNKQAASPSSTRCNGEVPILFQLFASLFNCNELRNGRHFFCLNANLFRLLCSYEWVVSLISFQSFLMDVSSNIVNSYYDRCWQLFLPPRRVETCPNLQAMRFRHFSGSQRSQAAGI